MIKKKMCNELIARLTAYQKHMEWWNTAELDEETIKRTMQVCINIIKDFRDYTQKYAVKE